MAFLGQVINHDEKGEMDDGGDFVIPLPIKDEERKSNLDAVMPIPNSEETQDAHPQIDCEVFIHRVEDDGLIVKVVPPTEPFMNQSRGAVEIVMLIDVSGSMNDLAPVPPSSEGEESEQKGFTVLDLTKHAACTIAESLNEHDTLCIVTFSTDCKVLLKYLPMSQKNKKLAKEKILSMHGSCSLLAWSEKAKDNTLRCRACTPSSIAVTTCGTPFNGLINLVGSFGNGSLPPLRYR